MAGYWGESGTQVTWKNPQFVAEGQRQTGGWYYNPSSNRVDRWWNQGTGPRQEQQSQRRSEPAFDYEGIIRRQEEQRKAKEEQQKKEQEETFGQYKSEIGGQEKLGAAYTRLQQEAGLPELQQQFAVFSENLGKLKTGLAEIDQAITERTEGKFVSEAQRARMVANERGAITTQIARLAESAAPLLQLLTGKGAEVGTRLNLEVQDQLKQLRPIEAKINSLSDRFAREMTGFNQDKTNELNLLMTKLQREQTLADQEWASAQQLLTEERAYERQKDLLVFEADLKKKNATPATKTDPSQYFKTGSATIAPTGPSVSTGRGFSYSDWLNAGSDEGFSNIDPNALNDVIFAP